MFCMILSGFPLIFVYFIPLVMEKVVLASESLFRPASGVQSTHLLVEIHNNLLFRISTGGIVLILFLSVSNNLSGHQCSPPDQMRRIRAVAGIFATFRFFIVFPVMVLRVVGTKWIVIL